jgi:predicted membrane chloride channel (bestrophin family)
VVVKYVLHRLGWEVISLNPLFSGLLAASVFLLGFLISGVLSDYKESEKIPGELAVSLEALFDEAAITWKNKGPAEGRRFLEHLIDFAASIRGWLHGRVSYEELYDRLAGMNDHFLALESVTTANFVARMKQEQTALRRLLTRVHVIKETAFVASGYAIAEAISSLLIFGFLLARIDPFYESLFFVALITFLFRYMLALIRDLDDPFEYDLRSPGPDEVSLLPLEEAEARMRRRFEELARG